jgi:hypothetical protein
MKFSDIFKVFKAKSSEGTIQSPSEETVDPAIFVDSVDPSIESERAEVKPGSRLDKFLRVDYEWYGYSDGYKNPSIDFMEMKLKSIRSEFRLVLDRSLDELKSRASEGRLRQISVSGMPGKIEEEIKEKIRQLESAILELHNQKELSVDDEGMVASAINRYSVGFTKGVTQYQREKFLTGDTGLF